MCGIVGYTHPDARVDPRLIRRITARLEHRGPDQQGVHVSDSVSLGAVRLKIIDLEGGDQPISSDDGQTTLVYNGEIYNYRELRQELERHGHCFRSRSDTEVVLRAFIEWDTACLPKLRGMFALALWQQNRRRLILARDRLGIKPLYFARRDGHIYFGSELKAILAHPEIPRVLDLAALDLYLSLHYVPWPRTMIEGIEKLPPGHYLEWQAGEAALRRYWELRFDSSPISEREAADQLDALLRRSIREHLVADVPLGVLLSGGIDSSTIVHYAAEACPRLKTFSISFAGRSFDETRYFRAVAERYGTDHHELDLARDLDLEGVIRRLADYADEPNGDSSLLPVWYLSQLCRRQVTVALSGEGADEIFGGYLTYQADRLARLARVVPALARRALLAAARRSLPVSEDKIGREYMIKRFLEGSLLPPLEAHCYWNGGFSSQQKQRLAAFAPMQTLDGLAQDAPAGFLDRFLWFDQRYYLSDDILAKVDRMSMAHALEVRPPYLDHEIVEFAARLPERLKIRGGCQKYLLKFLMRDRLPKSILRRKKIGFDIPAHDWLRRELKPLLLDALNPSSLDRIGVFRHGAVEKLMRDHFDRRVNAGFHLWGLLILLLWVDRWQIRSPASPEEVPAATPALTGSLTR